MRLARQLVAALAMGAALFLLGRALGGYFLGSAIERIVSLGLLVGTGLAVYFGLAWLLGGVSRETLGALHRSGKSAP